jgi:glycosyltransferase involved in cell wall biosynthesis
MRIIIIQSVAFFDPNGDSGGGEIHLHRMAMEWKKSGNEIILITNKSDRGIDNYLHYDQVFYLPVINLGLKKGSSTIKIYLQWIKQLKELKSLVMNFGKKRETIIISSAPTASDILIMGFLKRKLDSKGIVYFHLVPPSPLWHPLLRGGFVNCLLRWINSQVSLVFTKILAATPVMDHPRMLTDSGWRFDYGILNDDDFLVDFPSEIPAEKDFNLICFIARNDASKGVMDLPKIMSHLNEFNPKIKLIIAGSSPDHSIIRKMKDKIDYFSLQGNVVQMGFIRKEQKEELLRKSSVFVFPSYEDSWSLAVMEAAAYGCVPITYDLPAYDYLGQSAIKIPVGRVKEMAEAIYSVLNNKEKAMKISQDLRKAVSKYKLEKVAMYQLEYFFSLLNNLS